MITENIIRGELQPMEEEIISDYYFTNLHGGPRVEIRRNEFHIRYYNSETEELLQEFLNVKTNTYVQANIEYYVPWAIIMENIETGQKLNFTPELTNKTVYISFSSNALGDTLAWIPVVEEFRKKHDCVVYCTTNFNFLFKDVYKNILFIDKGTPLYGIQYYYKLGWFGSGHASFKNPFDCHTRNLQQIACDILGIPFDIKNEYKLNLTGSTKKRIISNRKKYVVITTCSTAQFKYWNYPNGWQKIADSLISRGYTVVNIGKQPNTLHNVVNMTGTLDFDNLLNVLQYSEYLISLPSGLSWLNWALNKKTVMITGISESFCEFQTEQYRIEPKQENICKGCFNNPAVTFDRTEWLFCPFHKGTDRHFECTKTITPEMVKSMLTIVEKDIKNKVKVGIVLN